MGSYTFRWEHPAQEVYVTGTFDNWTKSVRLEHNGSHFEKTVDLPSHDRILYKFVIDGHWTPDYNKYNENDGSGNVNNILFQHDLTPASSSQSQSQEEHSHMPGEFPETPAVESAAFGVAPLPAFPGMGNPTNIPAGQSLPHHSNFTSESIGSNVKLDKESYERSDAYPTSNSTSGIPEIGIFGVPPVSRNMIPESSLPMGEESRGYEAETGPNFNSAGAGASSAALAGQVPLEARGVPRVVLDSQREAHQGPEAAGNAEAVSEKSELEKELLSKVPTEQGVNESASDFVAGGSVPQAVQHSHQLAHQDPEAAANPEAVTDKSAMESELLQRVPTAQASDAYRNEPVSAVPDVVAESQYEAGQGPEAAGNPEAVSEKSQVEKELLSKVPTQNTSSDTGSGKIADYAAAGAAAVGLGGVAAAIGHRMQGQSTATSSIPSTGDMSQKASETYQSAASTAQSTYQDVAARMPSSTQEAHAQLPTSVQRNVPSSLQEATSSLPAMPTMFRTAMDQASNVVGNLTGANKTAANVPETVSHSIHQQYTRGPEAATNAEAVSEKSAVERELLSSIRPSQETGEHAPSYNTTSAPTSTSKVTGSSSPEAVQHSIADSSRGPEAAANPEAVSEKSQVERELLSSISPSQETGEHAPSYGATSSISAATSKAAEYLPSSTSEATGKAAEYAAAGAAAVGLGGVAAAIHQNAGTSGTSSSRAPEQGSSIPEAVQHSIAESSRGPEAAANPEAVSEKSQVERELLSSVSKSQETGEHAPTYSAVPSASEATGKAAEYAAAGAAAVGLGGVAAAIHHNAGTSSSRAPQQGSSYDGTSSFPSYDSLPSASETSNKAYNALPSVSQAGDKAAEYAASGASAVGLGGVANTIRNNAPSSSSATNSSNTTASVPEAVQDSIAHSSRGPEAAANPEAVAEKSQVERELLSSVHKTNESSEPAPTASAALSSTAPGLTSQSGMPLASPQLYDNDTAPAIAAMSQDLNLSERPPRTSSRAYEARSTTSSPSSAYTSTSSPPAQAYTTRNQSIIDRVFGAPVDGGESSSSAAPIAAGVGAGALGGLAAAGVAREVEEPKSSESTRASSSIPLSSHAHIKNETYGGSSAAFKHDPVSAGSAPITTATASDPRSVASAFANDPISPAATKSTSTTAATNESRSNPAATAGAAAVGTGAASIAAATAFKSSGLNASASDRAQTPATKAAASSATSSQKPTGGAMSSAMQQSRDESRDVSPMGGKQTALQQSPIVTSGVATHSAPAKSTPTQSQTPTPTPVKSNTATTPSSSASTPSKAPPASGPRLDIPSGESSTKKDKRRSFFGKIKDRMAGHNENEINGESEDEQDDSAYHSEDYTAVNNDNNNMSNLLQQKDGVDEKQDEHFVKEDITISAETEKEKTVVEEIAAGAAAGKRKVSTKNGAAFVAACVVAGLAIVLVRK